MKAYRIHLHAIVDVKSERKAIKLLDRLQAVIEPHFATDHKYGAAVEEIRDE